MSSSASAAPSPFVLHPTTRLGQIGLFFFIFFFFFFWFNFIVRIRFCFVFGLFETFFESEAKSDWLVLPSNCVSFSFVFLFFYLPILANNNLLLKIFCENIVVVFLNFHFLILNTTHLNNNNKLKKKHDYIKIIIIKLRDKEHHTFSYGPNLLLKLSTSHILHSYHLSHSHIQFTSEKREERERRI